MNCIAMNSDQNQDQIIPPISREFRVGERTVVMTFDFEARSLSSQWTPDAPDPKTLTPAECVEYRSARNAVLATVSERTGLRIAVAEVTAEEAQQLRAALPDRMAVNEWRGKLSEPKYSAYATAKLTLEVDVSSSWGEKCDLKQVYDQAARDAVNRLQTMMQNSKTGYGIRIRGEPEVTAIITRKDEK